MTAPGQKVGPLTQADLQAIWEGACDSSFTQPLEAAGEGQGFEAYTQMFAQFARVSQAIDTTTQALYILPSSGQSAPPAPRAQQATVLLTFTRAATASFVNWPVVIFAGTTFVLEQENDWGVIPGQPGQVVATGRRYLVTQTLVIPPGDLGPYAVQATAEFAGYGYNNPLAAYVTAGGIKVPGSINLLSQPGTGYQHDRASMRVTPAGAPLVVPATGTPVPQSATATLVAVNESDMFLPQHVGQYVLMTAGANAGKVGRIAGYLPPGTVAPASAVTLAYDQVVELTGTVGMFVPGESLQIKNGGNIVALATLLGSGTTGSGALRLVYTLLAGVVAAGNTVLGTTNLATGTVSTLLQAQTWTPAGAVPPNPNLSPGSGENWRILDWVTDLGVAVQNLAKPFGGTSPMLDELAYERGMSAAGGESADAFRQRVASPADTVSPNAIRRAVTRALGGEAGLVLDTDTGLDGFFYDRGDAGGCFYDTDVLVLTVSDPSFVSSSVEGDTVRWVDANGLLVANGYFGGQSTTSTSFNFILRGGPENLPPVRTSPLAGDRIIDLSANASSANTTLVSVVVPACTSAMREQVYLDYASFRGYFLVGVPPSGAGEFGFYWGATPASHQGGFFDTKSLLVDFYDGFPSLARGPWGNVFREVTRVKAGGVGFDLYVDQSLAPPFTPDLLEGLVIWLAADDPNIQLNAGKVALWPDKSGHGNHFSQVTSALQPPFLSSGGINGGPSIQGTGASPLALNSLNTLQVIMQGATAGDRFVVAKLNGDGVADPLGISWGPFDNGSYFEFSDGKAYDGFCSSVRWAGNAVGAGVLTVPFVQEVQSTNGLFAIIYNGSVNFSTGANVFNLTSVTTKPALLSIGVGAPMLGELAEVITFNRILTGNERSQVLTYLNSKWGTPH